MGKKTTKVWFTLVTALLVVVLFAGVTSVSASAVTTTQSLVKTETFTTNDGKFIVWNPLTGTIQYFDNGKYIGNYTGLQTLLDGQTWYIHDGRIDPSFTGIVKYDGARWYVSNGTVNKNKNGFVDSNGETYLVEKGKVSSKSGSYSANKGTYTLSSGRVTGVRFNVPAVNQKPKYPTGCEGAAATSLLRFYGYNVSLDEMIRAIPRENITVKNGRRYGPSIYEKFVGDPRGGYTSRNPGYGAFAPVVTKSMNNVIRNHGGSRTATNITGSSVNTLYQNLRNGSPQIVWATYNMNTPRTVNSWYINSTGKYFSYPRGTHVMVLRGYDANYVYFMDPYGGIYKTFSRSAFNSKYQLLGQQAILVK